MIKKPKRQLYNSPFFFPVFLVVTLLGFFFYALVFQPAFIIYLIGCLTISLVYLFFQRAQLTNRLAAIGLQKQGFLEKSNLMRVEIQREINAIESVHERIIRFSHLKELTEKLGLSFSSRETSQILSREVGQLFGRKDLTVILFSLQHKTGRLSLESSYGGRGDAGIRAKNGDIYDQWVVRNMKPLLVKDAHSDFRFDLEKIGRDEVREFRSLMSVPLMLDDKAVGILRLDSPQENYFDTEDIRLLIMAGTIGAVAIENAHLYEKIEDLAVRDGLTGLYLRRYLLDRLSHEIKRELRRKKQLAFLMIDLDHFKGYNDKYGHTAGDIVLKTVSMILAEIFDRPGNIICRYGGEELAVLLPDCSGKRAQELAERFRKKVEQQTIILRRKKTRITVSVGIAVFPEDAQIKEELIQQADQALYQAKKKGRNRVCVP